jgi:hypothetical protein
MDPWYSILLIVGEWGKVRGMRGAWEDEMSLGGRDKLRRGNGGR